MEKTIACPFSISILTRIFLFVCVLTSGIGAGQTVNTNMGTKFWFGYPGDMDGTGATYALNITSFFHASGSIYINNVFYASFALTPNAVARIVVTPSSQVVFDGEGIRNMAVHVVSDSNISLFYSEESSGPRNDNTYVLPDTLLGNDYYVMSYSQYAGVPSECLINSPGNTVRLQITPTVNTVGGHLAGVTYDTTVTSGQIYQIQGASAADLTGTHITAYNTTDPTQKFAVYGAMDLGSIGCNSTIDGVFEQLLPTYTWGKSYIFVSTQFADDICRVLASQNNTIVSFNGNAQAILNIGQYYDTIITPAVPAYISATKAVSVGKILQTEACNNDPLNEGDPSLAIVQPNEDMYLDSISFYSNYINGVVHNYLELVTRTADAGSIKLDGSLIPSANFHTLAYNSTYAYDTLEVDTGAHHLVAGSCGFLAYAGGMGGVTSTAAAEGVFLRNTTGGVPETTGIPPSSCTACNGTATVDVLGGVAPYTYLWSDASSQTTQTATGLCPGTYTVIIQEKCGISTDTGVVVVPNNAGYTVSLTDTNPNCVRLGNITAIPSGGGIPPFSYLWSNGETLQSDTGLAAGTYTCTVTDSGGCTFQVTTTLVNPIPAHVQLPNNDTTICRGSSVNLDATGVSTYSWGPSAGLSCTNCANPVATPSVSTTYTITGTDSNGCKSTDSVMITVNLLPPVTLSGNTTICAGQSTSLSASGGSSYSWTPSSGLSCNNCANPTASPTVTTTYTLSVSNGTCTKDTVIAITVDSSHITISPTQKICAGSSVILSATGGGSYLWSNGMTTATITVSPSSDTNYTVIVNNGCIDSASVEVDVDNSPLFACCNDTITLGSSDTLQSSGQNNVTWTPSGSLNCATCPDPVASPTVTTTYTVSATDTSTGCSVERTVTVVVEIPCNDFNVPNVFTPNNDGINDDFVVNVLNPSAYSIEIYNRWGKKVYSSTDPSHYWNGLYNGSGYLVPDGVYYYIIKATCGKNNYLKKGFVQVMGEK